MPNPYEAADVKRADECTMGAGKPSEEQGMNRLCQVIGADLMSGAGHSLWAAPHTYGGSMFSYSFCAENSGTRRHHARETRLSPHAGLLNSAGCVQIFTLARRLRHAGACQGRVSDIGRGNKKLCWMARLLRLAKTKDFVFASLQ